MTTKFDETNFWNEVGVETALTAAETARDEIIEYVPHGQLYTSSGEINKETRWGATLWQLTLFVSSLKNLGFS